ncbi:hypothetical protein L3X65_25475 [Vibrio diabolicus]|uniref:hypothetical protein n=1 Tax=Vibrio diabolicus TaxID=50719 RepID=UPI00211AFC0A|nr:hypothetical protein [Vibrio diabolicus]MCG9232467.1 hypothetical protein [Vibrio diabolicus]MCG9574403.1 hypothetical protein [Vibrio diabolicus]MCG9594167.1 hypothetical protein [Vibrio diabolicus]
MNEFLQIVGSLASIVGIPLAVYLYFKGQAEKYFDVRRDIVKRLSYQVGEGREISQFELNAVIDSMVREKRLKQSSISANSVVEDLISETISSPLLDKARKHTLVMELQRLHSECEVYESIKKNGSDTMTITQSSSGKVSTEVKSSEVKESSSGKKPEVFAISASLLTAMVASYTYTVGDGLLAKLTTISIDKAAVLGMVIALLAGFISGIVDWKKRK